MRFHRRFTALLVAAFALAALLALPAAASAVTPKIDIGIDFSCALDVTGSVKCWGAGGSGQMGNAISDDSLVPVQVSGLTDAVDISVGAEHACAIRTSGAAVCWGDGSYGRLGHGSGLSSNVPAQVTGLTSGVSAISAGEYHSCAVHNGAVKCWGLNSDRQLGDNDTSASVVPVSALTVTSGVTDVAAGSSHSCAVQNGAAKCWGDGDSGELGNGLGTDSGPVVNVTGLGSGVMSIMAADRTSCAVHNGAAKCWGPDFSGSLGNGAVSGQQDSPVQVDGLTSGVTHIDALRYHVCALQNATVYCWGENGLGELGDGTTLSNSTAQAVPSAPSPATDVSAGAHGTCATSETVAACWGLNDAGQIGNGVASGADTPQDVVGMGSGVTSLDLGFSLGCAIQSGAAKCWGGGSDYGQTGNGVYADSTSPVQVSGLTSGVTAISTGGYHGCAVHSGVVKCWGYDGDGSVGNGAPAEISHSTPQTVTGVDPGATDWALGLGASSSCARHDDDPTASTNFVFRCWGNASFGRLGNNSTSPNQTSPSAVTTITTRGIRIAGGLWHTCATQQNAVILQPNVLYCWGSDSSGALGDGGVDADTDEPVAVSGVNGAFDISAGSFFTCVANTPILLGPSYVRCWGAGSYGQLGNGVYGSSSVPVTVTGLTAPTSVAAGSNHVCAVDGGLVKCWGDNYEGQLGNGTRDESNVPVTVPGITTATRVAAGGKTSCALLTGGAVKCWGDGYFGLLGTGVATRTTSATTVLGYSPTPLSPGPALPPTPPTTGAFAPAFKVSKIKRKSGSYVFSVTASSNVPSGFTSAQACTGKLSGTLKIGRKRVKSRATALRVSGARCSAKLSFKSALRPAKRKKYALRATHPGNGAFLKYAKTTKLVLRKR